VVCHETFLAAVKALTFIDQLGCGHRCRGDHGVALLDLEAAVAVA
jgi:hypothetical protein